MSINANTGSINLPASASGTHIVTYTTPGSCSNTQAFTIITDGDDTNLEYPQTTYCPDAGLFLPTVIGLPNGSFASPTGLQINSTTGEIDINNFVIGSHEVRYYTTGAVQIVVLLLLI